MNTHVAQYSAAVPLSRLTRWLQRLDAWLVARRQAASDHAALAAMSARELRDIGIDPRCAHHGTRDWVRDWS